MDLGRPTTMTEARAIIGMVHYYSGMWSSWFHILDPLIEAYDVPKGIKLFYNDSLSESFNRGRTDKTRNLKNAEINFFFAVTIRCSLHLNNILLFNLFFT